MKTVLVLEEMPKTCGECPISMSGSSPLDDWKCPMLRHEPNQYGYRIYKSCEYNQKLSDCPLKQLPIEELLGE